MSETVYYAIGDVHGEFEKLERLLACAREDAQRLGAAYKIIFLGDLIDRGPDSRSVVACAMAATASGEAIALKGNHEELMLYAYDREDTIGLYHWANNGGDEAIESYQRAHGKQDHWRLAIDKAHLKWLRALPCIQGDEARGLVFVHAGIDPRTYPGCKEEIYLWTRSPIFYNPERWPDRPELEGLLVVHGHTPTPDSKPHCNPRRINVDTGACFGGPLTSVVLAPGEGPRFLSAW
jgi:serine/threonine protein phosphatase 1